MKVVLIGDSGVGKTSLVRRVCRGDFPGTTQPTVGAGLCVRWHDTLRVDIWDTAGQEVYRALVPIYLRGAHVIWHVMLPGRADTRRWDAVFRNSTAQILRVYAKVDKYVPEDTDPEAYYTSALTGQGCEDLFRATVEMMPRVGTVGTVVPDTVDVAADTRECGCC